MHLVRGEMTQLSLTTNSLTSNYLIIQPSCYPLRKNSNSLEALLLLLSHYTDLQVIEKEKDKVAEIKPPTKVNKSIQRDLLAWLVRSCENILRLFLKYRRIYLSNCNSCLILFTNGLFQWLVPVLYSTTTQEYYLHGCQGRNTLKDI